MIFAVIEGNFKPTPCRCQKLKKQSNLKFQALAIDQSEVGNIIWPLWTNCHKVIKTSTFLLTSPPHTTAHPPKKILILQIMHALAYWETCINGSKQSRQYFFLEVVNYNPIMKQENLQYCKNNVVYKVTLFLQYISFSMKGHACRMQKI